MSMSWQDPGPPSVLLTSTSSWRDPGPVAVGLLSQASASNCEWRDHRNSPALCDGHSAKPGAPMGGNCKRPRYDWQHPAPCRMPADGITQSSGDRASWQDPSGLVALCSDCGPVSAASSSDGGRDGQSERTKRRPVIDLHIGAIHLVAAGQSVHGKSAYAKNGASIQRIRGVMNASCPCRKACHRQLTIQRVTAICELFWSLTSLEQEHLVSPHVFREFGQTCQRVSCCVFRGWSYMFLLIVVSLALICKRCSPWPTDLMTVQSTRAMAACDGNGA